MTQGPKRPFESPTPRRPPVSPPDTEKATGRPSTTPVKERTGSAAECLASSYYLDCDDRRVKSLARIAVGDEKDSWRKALRVERSVHRLMSTDHSRALEPASEVARTLRGDCRAYAMLTTAMCRAAGVPARTALGLIYVEKGRKPFMGFHMWTEVLVEGRWIGLDATLGQGRIGASHIKISHSTWHKTRSLTPLLPVRRILGKIAIQVGGS